MTKRWAVRTYGTDDRLLDEQFFWTERGAYRRVRVHQSTQAYRIFANSRGGVPYIMIVQPR